MNDEPALLPPKELDPRADFWADVYQDIAWGNRDAQQLLCAWANFCHALDDCVDRDKPVEPSATVRVFLDWTLTVSENPFFQIHGTKLLPLVIASANAFLDAEAWASDEDAQKRRFADAWRSFFSQFTFHVAFIVGGFGHMRSMSDKYRGALFAAQHEAEVEEVHPTGYVSNLPEGIAPTSSKKPLRPPFQPRKEEDWQRLITFAASFNHEIDKRFPYLVIMDEDEKWVGYAMMISVPPPGAPGRPVFCTSWHPGVPHRQAVEGIRMFTDWGKTQFGGMATIIPKDSPFRAHMESLGYESWESTFYVTKY